MVMMTIPGEEESEVERSNGENETMGLMTPRSKVRAALAAIDSDSDEDVLQENTPVTRDITPRSKVRLALKAVDSDEEEVSGPQKTQIAGKSRSALAAISGNVRGAQRGVGSKIAGGREVEQGKLSEDEEEGQEEEDEEEAIVVPRGRLAGSLKSKMADRESTSSPTQRVGNEDAYTRIRERLLNGTKKTQDEALGDGTLPRVSATPSSASRAVSPTESSARNLMSESEGRLENSLVGSNRSPSLSPPAQLAAMSPMNGTRHSSETQDHEDLPTQNRFLELVAKKRAEREAKDAEEARKRAEKTTKERELQQVLSRDGSESDGLSDDDLAEKHLTQSARPARKASKKALEEMNRETQRMNRNMQLAHQAKTKKKISKDSLLARFNFRTSVVPSTTITEHPSSSTLPSSAPQSDGEDNRAKESPPTSPAESVGQPLGKSILFAKGVMREEGPSMSTNQVFNQGDDCEDLPQMADLIKHASALDKGKAKVDDFQSPSSPVKKSKKRYDFAQRPVRVSLPNAFSQAGNVDLDSDSESEQPTHHKTKASKSKNGKLDAFHRLPSTKFHEGRSLLTLRALAHLNSPGDQSRGKKPSMNNSDMQDSLQKRARLQALQERKAKIDDLRARGILVQSTEEREKDQAEVENLLEKARRQAEELQQKEKKSARKQKIANGDLDSLNTSDEEDEDYADGEDGDADVELSGSDEEENEGVDADEAEGEDDGSVSDIQNPVDDVDLVDEETERNQFLDAQAEEEDDGDEEAVDSNDDMEDEIRAPQLPQRRRNKIALEDEEDDDEMAPLIVKESPSNDCEEVESQSPVSKRPQLPPMLGQGNPNVQSLGLTQAFAATMAETQEELAEVADEEQDSMGFFQPPPEPDLPLFFAEDSQAVVRDSQTGIMAVQDTVASHRVDLHFSQSQLQHDSLGPLELQRETTDLTEIPDPTQDAGFTLSSPAPERFVSAPPSTVDTVVIPTLEEERSPVTKSRGRLIRGRPVNIQADAEADDEAVQLSPDAFQAMEQRRKKKADEIAFNKKKSNAKEMVEEQAMESEDEYAGLGGASDDESGGEEDQDVKDMMDHSNIDVDEGQLAALYANKERDSDEKAVEKLFKDINNGGLRRKRGADFDLSDSDDDGEARRRRKQREFAKMRKALLADEKVGQIAEDPKKLAFLRAIEDREDDDDLDFLEKPAEDSFRVVMDTQEDGTADSQSQKPSSLPATQNDSIANQQRRPLQETTANMRPPAAARRTPAGSTTARKPSTLAEIRESVSFLTETPGAMNEAPDEYSSVSEAEADNKDDDDHNNSTTTTSSTHNPRRTTSSTPIVDRLVLKRASTASSTTTSHSSSSSTSGTSSRLAYFDPTTTTTADGFKVPSLLRRATTNTNLSLNEINGVDKHGISTYATTERSSAGNRGGGGGSGSGSSKKKSSVNYFAREMEKRGAVEGVERRRREERERRAREREKGGVLGRLMMMAGGGGGGGGGAGGGFD